jgi:hypothetical protein
VSSKVVRYWQPEENKEKYQPEDISTPEEYQLQYQQIMLTTAKADKKFSQ